MQNIEDLLERVRADYPSLRVLVQDSIVGSCYLPKESVIILEPHMGWETLLHELGHHVNRLNDKESQYDELLAWQTAIKLAESYGLQWTTKQDAEMLRCLTTYGIFLKNGNFTGSEKAVARYAASLLPKTPLWQKVLVWTVVAAWAGLGVGALGWTTYQSMSTSTPAPELVDAGE